MFIVEETNPNTWDRHVEKGSSAHTTCADEQDVVGAVHGLHSVHQQFAELVVNTHSDQEGALSQRQHIFLKECAKYNTLDVNEQFILLCFC